MKDKVKELSADVIAVADTISVIEEQLQEEDMTLLKVRTVKNAANTRSMLPKTLQLDKSFFFILFPEF